MPEKLQAQQYLFPTNREGSSFVMTLTITFGRFVKTIYATILPGISNMGACTLSLLYQISPIQLNTHKLSVLFF